MNKTEIKNFPPPRHSNQFAWEVLADGAWKGQPCFIIGGGPSLSNFDWSLLEGKLTIGINRVYEKLQPSIIFGMDHKFVRWILMGKYGDLARKKFLQSPAMKIWLCTATTHIPGKIYVLKCWRNYTESRTAFPFTMKGGIGHGNNSGYGALNLAACLGANPIYLLGFDMKHTKTQTHWHNGHPEKKGEDVMPKFIENLRFASIALKEKGIEVINLNPDSALPWFPKAEPGSVLNKDFSIKKETHISRENAKYGPIIEPFPAQKPAPQKVLPPLFISGPYGFGDTLYLRSIVKSLAKIHRDIYIRTTLPEAFWDMENVKFVRPNLNKLISQEEHIKYLDKAKEHKWVKPPKGTAQKSWESFVPSWRHKDNSPDAKAIPNNPRGEESTTKFFVNEFDLVDFDFSFSVKQEWFDAAKKIVGNLDTKRKKLCIVRPPTIHKEWACYTRNPKPEYIQALVDKYKDEYFFISVANNKAGLEWFEGGKLKGINKRYDHGELPITTLFGLIKQVDMVITAPDFFSVLAIATRTKCFCIFGGCAKPTVVFDKNMDLENFEYAAPEPFCNCMRMEHLCNKEIPIDQIVQKFEALAHRPKILKKVSIGIPPGIGDMHWVLAKLESFKEKNNLDKIKIVIDRNPSLSYSREFLRLVPFIDEVDDGQKRLPFRFSIAGGDGIPLQRNVNGVDYLMEFNSRLEQGVRIEDVLPEYDVNFNYPIDNPREAKSFARIIKKGMGGKLYLFYASSVGGNKNWCKGTWEPKHWVKLANKIYDETKIKTILMGAQWDSSYGAMIKSIDSRNTIQNMIGKTSISEALGLLREASFLVSFLSGLVILSTRFKIPCASFWPTLKQAPHWINPEKFKVSWIPPAAKENGYMPFDYGGKNTNPKGIFDALRKYL